MHPQQPPLITKVFGLCVICAALYAVLFSNTPNFSDETAERILVELSHYLDNEAAKRGKEAKLQYSGIEVQGFAYDKWARLNKPSLDVITQQWHGGNRFSVSTSSVDLLPAPNGSNQLALRLPEQINLIQSSELLALIKPLKPLIYTLYHNQKKSETASRHHLTFPGDVVISTLDPRDETTVKLAKPAKVELIFSEPQHRIAFKAGTADASIHRRGVLWRMVNSDVRYDSYQKTSDIVEGKGMLALNNVSYHRPQSTVSPVSITASWATKDQRNISGSIDASTLTIDHGLIADGTMKIALNGTLHHELDDAAYGEFVMEIANPSSLIDGGWIAAEKKSAARTLLNDIMGTDMTGHKQAIITIERKKNGRWMVGKLTLDELLARGLKDIFIFGETDEKAISDNEKANPS